MNNIKNFESQVIINKYKDYVTNKGFPCVAAKASLALQQIRYLIVDHMGCPQDDSSILQFIYDFVDEYRGTEKIFYSAVVIFKGPELLDEVMFDKLLWQRLQALSDLDAQEYNHDKRVSANPASASFSFSLKEEAFFVIGLGPTSRRPARQFSYPTLVFNPHAQFEEMRQSGQYARMKSIVRKRDISFSGSVNPMLKDFGEYSEVYQYSGLQHDKQWQCPLKANMHEHNLIPDKTILLKDSFA